MMSHQTQWLLPHQILFCYSAGEVNINHLQQHIQTTIDYFDAPSNETVHIIHNLTDACTSITINQARTILSPLMEHPKLGSIVFYGLRDKSTQFLLMLVASTFRVTVRFVDTYETALNHLQQHISENIIDICKPDPIKNSAS